MSGIPVSVQLMHSTIRIQTKLANGDISTGTGFFYLYDFEPGMHVPVIVTNKHVIHDSVSAKLIFSRIDKNNQRMLDKSALSIEKFSQAWIEHPDSQVDLCILPLKPYAEELRKKGLDPYLKYLDVSNIPTEKQWKEFTALEDIIMVGYPNGIWDEVNNLPIVRKGITGTPLFIDYNGRKEFLIDVATYPGSSGSPIFVFNEGSYSATGGLVVGSRLFFVGIAYGVYQYKASGKIVIEEIPTVSNAVTHSLIPNNLGIVIKSSRLRDFESLILDRFRRRE